MKEFFNYYCNHDPKVVWFIISFIVLLSLIFRAMYVKSSKGTSKRDSGWQERLRRELGILPSVWDNLTYGDRRAIRRLRSKCRSLGVEMELAGSNSVPYPGGGSRVSGYFVGDDLGTKPKLCVAVGKPTSEWMTVLLHESSHMDQWKEKCPAWLEGFRDGVDVYDVLQEWIDGKRELSDPELDDVIRRCVAIELDCEKRTVKKMMDCGMEWYTLDYVRKANSYIWCYCMVKMRRRWYSVPPYELFEVWGPMPDRFMKVDDYLKMSWEMSMKFDVKCFGFRKIEVPS